MSGGGYREELEAEMAKTDPNSHASRLVAQEIERLSKGGDDEVVPKKEKAPAPMIELHTDRPQKMSVKVRIPIKEHPRYNFVGKLLGPKGQTLKELQQQTGCKMAIMGKGSMREKDKEEELRKEGGKYAHLNEDLHVLLDCFTEPTDGYHRLAAALVEVRKYLIPELNEDPYGEAEMGGHGGMGMNGASPAAPRGRGSFRGGPPSERGAPRGGFRGRGGAGGPPVGRGAPPAPVRGGAPPRGAPRGAPAGRGAPRGARAAPPPAAHAPSYDGYSTQGGYGSGGAGGYGAGGYDASYDDGYSASRADYAYPEGDGYSSQAGYDSYGGGDAGYGAHGGHGYGGAGYQAKAAPPTRGGARPPARAHPYGRQPPQSGY